MINKFITFIMISLIVVSCTVGDSTPPGTIEDLIISTVNRLLNWTAPGDDGNSGRATIYFIRFMDDTQVAEILGLPNLDNVPFSEIQDTVINNFGVATQIPDFKRPQKAGSPEIFPAPRLDITGLTRFFYSIQSNDEVGNSSNPSNVAETTTELVDVEYVDDDLASCLGNSIAAGDFNGDENDNIDIAIGDPCRGRVYIFFGQEDLTLNGSAIIDVDSADVTIIGNANEMFGSALGMVSNFGGNSNTEELAIGIPGFDNSRGEVFIVFGSIDLPSVIDFTAGDEPDRIIEGENTGDNFGGVIIDGESFTGGGDLFFVSAIGANSSRGNVYLFQGQELNNDDITPASDAMAVINGQSAGDMFGFSMAIIGDVDDGFDELAVGSPVASKAYIIPGTNRNNIQNIDLSVDTSGVIVIDGTPGDQFGFSIAGDGDINEDGESDPDTVIGAPSRNMGTGSVFLYSGSDIEEALENGGTLTFSNEFNGITPGGLFGSSLGVFNNLTPIVTTESRPEAIILIFEVSNADFAVGAPGTELGDVYIFLGRDDFPPVVSASEADISLTGDTVGSNFGTAIEQVGDLNMDNLEDFAVGGNDFVNVEY